MFFRTNNVSIRTILKLTAGGLLLAGGVRVASAANTGITPQLVPYEMQLIAGNSVTPTGTPTVHSSTSSAAANIGYAGDGFVQNPPTSFSTLNGPKYLAVDAAGNVYWSDTGNAVIREVNAQTGIVNTVAGTHPTGCNGFLSCHSNTGCSDGVAAYGNPIGGGLAGIAVDAYGNIFFADTVTQTVSVVYRGGTRVANFITLEDPGGVSTSGGVQVGFVYHVAGTVNLKNCAGTSSSAASATAAAVPAGDGNLAFNSGATFSAIGPIGLDSAGNLFIGDAGINSTVRVINTQAQAQTYFAATVQPGYIQSIVNCSTLTTQCPVLATPETPANTGVYGPAAGGVLNSLANGNGAWMSTDGYGNIYELNTKGGNPGLNLAVAYAGGTPLANLILQANNGEQATNSNFSTGVKAVAGDFYYLLQSITLRPSSSTVDPVGNVYYLDNHYGQIYRFDVNAQASSSYFLQLSYLTSSGLTNDNNRTSASTVQASAPAFCYPYSGQSTTNPVLSGFQTADEFGNGCPAVYAEGVGVPHNGTGLGTVLADGPGNIWIADLTNQMIREVTLDNVFPATPVGQPWNPTTYKGEQGIQVHFDPSNLPTFFQTSAVSGNPATSGTTSFSMAPGIADFTLNTVQADYANATTTGIVMQLTTLNYASLTGTQVPACTNLEGDKSTDCVAHVIFSPTLPGLRTGQLVATTYNGSVYTFGVSGIGTGSQLAIDGGAQATVPVTGLGSPGQISVTQQGLTYIADPSNNRVVVIPAGGGTQTTVGTGLKGPMGVAVDVNGNVYIADTGNNRIVEVSQATGAQTVIGGIEATGAPAYTNYAFKSPEGLAVDVRGNVYVADTGNGKVVIIPSDPRLGAATPLLQYPGAPTLSSPVAVALDSKGNLYVADPGTVQVLEIPAGGGDLQTLPGALLTGFGAALTAPSGVAVDAAGNVYVSDSGSNQVYELPAGSGLGTTTLPINFTGLNLTSGSYVGGSLSLDANSNLYVADSGNGRILFENRTNPTVACGLVAQGQPAVSCGGAPFNATSTTANVLTVTNIGNANAAITSPFTNITASNSAFTLANNCSGTLSPGSYCTISPTFLPTSNGALSETFTVNGNAGQSVKLTGTGEQPLVKLVLSNTPTTGSGTAGTAIVVTATLTQPTIPPGGTPTGSVTFSYTVDGVAGTTATQAIAGGAASFTIPAASVLPGHLYVVSATYTGDTLDSQTVASPLSIQVAGNPLVTATATSVTYTYGQPVPTITGTVTGITDPSVTYKFVSAATSTSPAGTYPIFVVFSGGTAANYGYGAYPQVFATGSTSTPATVTENPAALAVTANNATIPYGAINLAVTANVAAPKGVVFDFSPSAAQASILNAGTYPIVPTVIGNAAANYKVTVTNGTLTVTTAPTALAVAPTATQFAPTTAALAANPILISVGTQVTSGKGTPTGTVTIADCFLPVTTTAYGGGVEAVASGYAGQLCSQTDVTTSGSTTVTPLAGITGLSAGMTVSGPGIPAGATITAVGSSTFTLSTAATATTTASVPAVLTLNTTILPALPLTAGSASYTLTSTTPGAHYYSFTYSGDANFQKAASATSTSIVVDNPDFSITAPTTPIIIAPGVLPGGSSSVFGEASATPETAVVSVVSVLSYAGTIYLGCEPQSPSYVTCTVSPPVVNITSANTASAPASSLVSISTPATLPVGFFGTTSQLRHSMTTTVLAFLPFGILAFCVRRNRRRLSNALWMLILIAMIGTGLNGCADTSVHYYTPVPSGAQIVTVYACSVQASCTATPTSPITGAGAGTIRSFSLTINIQ